MPDPHGPRRIDAHHLYMPIKAVAIGKALEPCRLFWLQDCTPAGNQLAANYPYKRAFLPAPWLDGGTMWNW